MSEPATSVQVIVTPRVEDYEEAMDRLGGKAMRPVLVMCALMMVVFGSSLITGIIQQNVNLLITSGLMVLFIPALYFLIKRWMRQEMRKRYDAAVEMREVRTYTFSEAGIEY